MNTCCLNNSKNQDTEEENRPSLKATQQKKAQKMTLEAKMKKPWHGVIKQIFL